MHVRHFAGLFSEPTRQTDFSNICLRETPFSAKRFITQLMHNIWYVDTIKIIKYLKVLQPVSDQRGSIIREPCTVLGQKLKNDSIVSVNMDKVSVMAAYSDPLWVCVVHCIWRHWNLPGNKTKHSVNICSQKQYVTFPCYEQRVHVTEYSNYRKSTSFIDWFYIPKKCFRRHLHS